ncbi:MAG: RDD family protein [Phycisphaerales bacterium]
MTLIKEGPNFFRRIAAFGLDYLLIAGYLVVLAIFGSILVFGPMKDVWQGLMSSPVRMDLIAFITLILPVILYFTLMESSESGATFGKRRLGLRVVHKSGERLSRWRALVRSVVKFLPWQLEHTCLFHIPGWPMETQEPPVWVIVGLVLGWVAILMYVVTLAVGPTRRTLYDWVSGSQVVMSRTEDDC